MGTPDCSMLEHKDQLAASHEDVGETRGNAEDSNKDEQGTGKHSQ